MKKNLPARIGILMVMSILTACGGTVPVATTIPAATTTSPAATEMPATATETPAIAYNYTDMVVGLVQTGSENLWLTANNASFRETAIALDVKLKYYDSALSSTKHQINAFRKFIEDPEVNVIVIMPAETAGLKELLQKANNAGKVVLIANRRVDASEDLYATFVGNDFVEEGRKAGREMCKLLEGSQKKNIWELVGDGSSEASVDRGKGFHETATECGIVVTNSQSANWNAVEGKQITEMWLKESRDVQGIFAQYDEMGFGAIEALKEAGLVPAVDVKIISVDATSAAFKAMLNGELNATVECNPLFAPQVYEAALAALNGETLPKYIPVKESMFFMDDPNLKEIAAGRKY